jgi:hypothetical protein
MTLSIQYVMLSKTLGPMPVGYLLLKTDPIDTENWLVCDGRPLWEVEAKAPELAEYLRQQGLKILPGPRFSKPQSRYGIVKDGDEVPEFKLNPISDQDWQKAREIVAENGGGRGCTCDEAFRSRKRIDPSCPWCNFGAGTVCDIAQWFANYRAGELSKWVEEEKIPVNSDEVLAEALVVHLRKELSAAKVDCLVQEITESFRAVRAKERQLVSAQYRGELKNDSDRD